MNWTNFENNLSDADTLAQVIPSEIKTYTGNDSEGTDDDGNTITAAKKLAGNCWAPDVIYNTAMKKWCMYLSVNGDNQYSCIVLLTADNLDGAWSYMGPVVFSGITSSNIGTTDYEKVTGSTSVAEKYSIYRNSSANLLYGVNAIDPAVSYDDDGNLWMSYGSWFGGIYLLKLDSATGLRDYDYTYENNVVDDTSGEQISDSDFTQSTYSGGGFTAYSDVYLGIHIAGGHHATAGGEGSYILKIGDWYYLFISYGGYAPDGGYNMRVFRSETITGFDSDGNFVGYQDVSGNLSIFSSSSVTGSVGQRVMSGYSWSWWDFSYVAQGHNSVLLDDDGSIYLVYHNKYMDGTTSHVMKVHQLLVNSEGWLVTSPMEATIEDTDTVQADAIATGLSASDIAGTYGVLYMTKNNGSYGSGVSEQVLTLNENGTIGDTSTNTWTYDSETGEFTFTYNFSLTLPHTGYLMWQNLEGTNIRTLVFTGQNTTYATDSNGSVRYSGATVWGYQYPSEEAQAQYLLNSSYAIPSAAGSGVTVPTGTLTSDLWNEVSVSLTYSGGTLTATSSGSTVATYAIPSSDEIAEYDSVSAGQTLLPVETSNGISISFDYSGYLYDYISVLQGNGFIMALGVLYSDDYHIYEWQDCTAGNYTKFADEVYNAFLTSGTARATVSFNTDGSVSFYRDGVFIFSHEASATLYDTNNNGVSTTVGDLVESILSEFENGTVSVAYDLENVVISEQIASASELEYITDSEITLGLWSAPNDYYAVLDGSTVTLTATITGITQSYAGIYAIIYAPSNGANVYYIIRPDCPVVVDVANNWTWTYWSTDYYSWDTSEWYESSYIAAGSGTVTWTISSSDGVITAKVSFTASDNSYSYTSTFTLLKTSMNGATVGFGTDSATASNVSVTYAKAATTEEYTTETEEIDVPSWTSTTDSYSLYEDTTITISGTVTPTESYGGYYAIIYTNGSSTPYFIRVEWPTYNYSGWLVDYFRWSTSYESSNLTSGTYIWTISLKNGILSVVIDIAGTATNYYYLMEGVTSAQVAFSYDAATISGTTVTYPVVVSDETHTHSYTSSTAGDSCTGYVITYTCSCGDSYTETSYVNVTGHSYTAVETAATKGSDACITYTCSVCGDSFIATREGTALGYTVTFVVDGTSSEETYQNGTAISLSDIDYEKKGYAFAGWSDGTTIYETGYSYTVTGDVTFTATWTVNTYSITYTLNGGTISGTYETSYTVESETITLPTPTREGYTFAGWYTESDFSGSEVTQIASGSTGNVALYASWTVNSYDITYELGVENGTHSNVTSADYGSTVTLTFDLTKEDYYLSGVAVTRTDNSSVSVSVTSENDSYSFTMPAYAVTVTVEWTEVGKYAVTYAGGADGVAGLPSGGSYAEGNTVTLSSAEPTRTGYTFTGWLVTANNEEVTVTDGAFTMPAYAVTVTAQWTAVSYTITYNLNGGTLSDETTSYTIESDTITLVSPTRTGYTFAGWYTTSALTGDAVTQIASGSTGNVTLYASWTANTYTVSFSTGDSSITVTYGGTYGTLPTPTQTGYTFAGWYLNSDYEGDAVTTKTTVSITADTTLYAKWTAVSYTITYNLNGGTLTGETTSYTIESDTITLVSPTKTGYTFAGWYTTSALTGDAVTQIESGSTGDVTLYASWTANSYTVSFSTGDSSITVTYGGTYGTLPSPEKTGYTFAGWYLSSDYEGDAVTAETTVSITADTTLYAKWTAVSYSITYNLNGGTLSGETTSYTIESETITLVSPTRTGYTFAGWYTTSALTGDAVTQIASGSTGNVTLYASWTANTYTVSFSTGDSSITVTYGGTYGTLPTPTQTGYTFAGWYLSEDYSGDAVTAETTVSITADATLYAKWTAVSYTVTLVDGDESTPTAYDYGTQITLTSPTKDGYTFDGWSDGTDTYAGGTTYTVTGDVTLTAQWTKNKKGCGSSLAAGGAAAIVLLCGAALIVCKKSKKED